MSSNQKPNDIRGPFSIVLVNPKSNHTHVAFGLTDERAQGLLDKCFNNIIEQMSDLDNPGGWFSSHTLVHLSHECTDVQELAFLAHTLGQIMGQGVPLSVRLEANAILVRKRKEADLVNKEPFVPHMGNPGQA